MSPDPNAEFDHAVLDLIDHHPAGAVPATPSYQDALKRLQSTHQVYASADHKDGFVTARALASLPAYHPENLDALLAGTIEPAALESNTSVYDRYVQSLAAEPRRRAEAARVRVLGKPALHRAQHGGATVGHEPLHVLFLVPGAGPHPGLAGNYLHGSVFAVHADQAESPWAVQVHDSDDGLAAVTAPTLSAALGLMQEAIGCAPFHLSELEALGFEMR